MNTMRVASAVALATCRGEARDRSADCSWTVWAQAVVGRRAASRQRRRCDRTPARVRPLTRYDTVNADYR